ncbi:hypothetical protein L3Y34_017572 [Caenorhabditis briggsae]|uniref:Laminin G domain-containing protein n=2 Tax=Caenorhabditis briggsae TaxID=6238 RepID=A0AAE9DJ31_CAEBR|nr:hypothetical protein L3Y34_017572 [Caenorhabditis briggsae]
MRPLQVLLFSTLMAFCLGVSSHVFQGSCASEHVLCEQLCETLSPEAYECSCWEGHLLQDDGLSCKLNTDVQYEAKKRTRKLETSTRPFRKSSGEYRKKSKRTKPVSFKGSNYLEFPIKEDTYLETNITIQFKVEEHKDGIIFFGGELMGDDFLSITLDGPNIVTRHDCGEGTIEDMYHGQFKVGEWHEIQVWRKNCDLTEMSLDGGRKLVDHADEFRNYKGITMDEGVFLGAAPHNIEFLQQKTGTSDGFKGCVRLLIVNGETLLNTNETINKAYETASTYYCGEIDPSQKRIVIVTDEMLANGTTMEDDDEEVIKIEMYDLTQPGIPKIDKPPGMHPSIAKMLESTATPPPLGHPVLKEILGYGDVATTPVPVQTTWKVAHFNGGSKIVVPAPDSILSYVELSIQFKTEKSSGVIFFWKEDAKFLTVTLENSFIKVYASLGVDATILRSENAVSLYHWHKLEVWRSGKGVLLKVNKQGWVESELHASKSEILEGTGHIFLGSPDIQDVPTVMKDIDGFSGCVKRVRLNGRSIVMQSVYATNVSECFQDPCASFGCPKGCISHNSAPVCQCDWPKTGRKCTDLSDTTISAMKFSGLSYLEVDNEDVMSHITGDSLDMAVNFKIKNTTQHLRQILVSAGDVTHEDDFFELSVDNNKFVRFALNLGSGTIVLTHPKRIVEDTWNTVEVIRKKNSVKLSVNGEDPISTFAPDGAEQLNVYRNVFIGNNHLPEGSTDGHDFAGFDGCIISVKFDQTIINHPIQTKAAINIQDCAI